MKNQAHILLLFLLSFTLIYNANGQSMQFIQEHVRIGPIDDWSQDAAIFIFTNTSDEKLAILRAETPEDVKVTFPRRFIAPGESDTIIAWYMPPEPGPFSSSFSILNSIDKRKQRLQFSGDVLSYDACPDPAIAPGSKGPEREILVLDSLTREPINNANLDILHNDRKRIKGRTNRSGILKKDLKPGLYDIRVTAENYLPLQAGFYLNFSRKRITLLMVQEVKPEPLITSIEGEDVEVKEEEEPAFAEASAGKEDDFVIDLSELQEGKEIIKPEPEPIVELDENGELSRFVFAENNLVFLIDVSSSMRTRSKMDRLVGAVGELFMRLRDIDRVSLLTYSRHSETLAEGIPGNDKDSLIHLVNSLQGRGSTYGIVGLTDAYETARKHLIPGGNNQLIIATDGEFNSPGFSDRKLERMMKDWKDSGIILSVIGFGQNEQAIERMAMMAKMGGGSYLDFRPGMRVEEILLKEIKMNSRKD